MYQEKIINYTVIIRLILNFPQAHLHDTNAYVRSKALQIWLQLCNNMAIPLPRQQHLLELLIGRLHDKSTSVRKYAIQLLKSFLVNNPFGAKVNIAYNTLMFFSVILLFLKVFIPS